MNNPNEEDSKSDKHPKKLKQWLEWLRKPETIFNLVIKGWQTYNFLSWLFKHFS